MTDFECVKEIFTSERCIEECRQCNHEYGWSTPCEFLDIIDKLQTENAELRKENALMKLAMKGSEQWGAVEATKDCVLLHKDGSILSAMLSSGDTAELIQRAYNKTAMDNEEDWFNIPKTQDNE